MSHVIFFKGDKFADALEYDDEFVGLALSFFECSCQRQRRLLLVLGHYAVFQMSIPEAIRFIIIIIILLVVGCSTSTLVVRVAGVVIAASFASRVGVGVRLASASSATFLAIGAISVGSEHGTLNVPHRSV